MSRAICIMGESGAGKTTSLRNLPPEATYYIDCDGKGLSWRGWRGQYSGEKKNYKATNDVHKIQAILQGISEKSPRIKYVVIDTINGIMVADEMQRIKEKGYDKWADLAFTVWDLIDKAYSYREDLTLIFTAHTQTERDDAGFCFTRIKTNGRKLEKISLESKFTTVLLAKCGDGKYFFETKAQNSTCKTPMGAFESDRIDNDIVPVLEALADY